MCVCFSAYIALFVCVMYRPYLCNLAFVPLSSLTLSSSVPQWMIISAKGTEWNFCLSVSVRTQSINGLCTGRWSPWRRHRCTACRGKSILRDITVTFVYIYPKTPLRSWTWLYHQKANKTTFPTISCPCGNIVNFSHTSRIHLSANNTSFRPVCVPPTTLQPLGGYMHSLSAC